LKSGPDIEKEIYTFKDKAGRMLGLRFDLTVGLTRYVVSNPELPKPIKLGAFSVQWRYDEPQYGRYRSFYAWDVEIYGGDEENSTVETIMFIDQLMKKVELSRYEFRISDRKLIEKLITKYLNLDATNELMRTIDKLPKVGEKKIVDQLVKYGVNEDSAAEFIKLLTRSKSSEEINSLSKEVGYEGPLYCAYDILKSLNIPIKIDLSIVRGLDYYDGIVFEVYDTQYPNIGALCGGGAYNRLPRVFGSNITAFGAAGGVERLILSLEKHGKRPWDKVKMKSVFIAVVNKELYDYAFKIAKMVRNYGLICDINLSDKKLRKQMETASKRGFDYVIIVGREEKENMRVTIRDMKKEKQITIKFDKLMEFLNSLV
jgi:histidyl-tRNA synthetase